MARSFLWIVLVFCMTLCKEGQSICDLESTDELVLDLNEALHNATNWLLSQRTEDWGWPLVSTATAILSLQLSNDSWYSRGTSDLTAQLSVKQLQIELLAELSNAMVTNTSNGEIRTLPNISPGNLAYYMMALNSTCHDVTDFYKNDLVKILTGHMDQFPKSNFNNYFQYGLALLALCQSGVPIKEDYVQEIIDGQDESGFYQFGSDVVSIAVMAMSCIKDQVSSEYSKQLTQKIKRGSNYLRNNQNGDSTFGNQISTALAAQALMAAGTTPNAWNCESAIRYVLDQQEPDGDFGSQGGTIQILPLLASKTFASIKDVDPYCDAPTEGNGMEGPQIQITLIIENDVDTSAAMLNLSVAVPENSTLYQAMLLAAEQYPDTFSFVATDTSFGHSINEINGVAVDYGNSYYWIILLGPERTSASTGVDGITTEDGGLYILQYKSFA